MLVHPDSEAGLVHTKILIQQMCLNNRHQRAQATRLEAGSAPSICLSLAPPTPVRMARPGRAPAASASLSLQNCGVFPSSLVGGPLLTSLREDGGPPGKKTLDPPITSQTRTSRCPACLWSISTAPEDVFLTTMSGLMLVFVERIH